MQVSLCEPTAQTTYGRGEWVPRIFFCDSMESCAVCGPFLVTLNTRGKGSNRDPTWDHDPPYLHCYVDPAPPDSTGRICCRAVRPPLSGEGKEAVQMRNKRREGNQSPRNPNKKGRNWGIIWKLIWKLL